MISRTPRDSSPKSSTTASGNEAPTFDPTSGKTRSVSFSPPSGSSASGGTPNGRPPSQPTRTERSAYAWSTSTGRSTGGPAGNGQTPFTSESGRPFLASNGKQGPAAETPGITPRATLTGLQVNWHALTPRGQAILRTIVLPISAGFSPGEIARDLGTSTSWVSNRLDELRRELARQQPELADSYGSSRGGRKGSFSRGCPAAICRVRSSSASNSAPSRMATFESQSQMKKMMTAPRLPYVLL
jgi:hypothetical protein